MPSRNDKAELRGQIEGLQQRVAGLEEVLREHELNAGKRHGAEEDLLYSEETFRKYDELGLISIR